MKRVLLITAILLVLAAAAIAVFVGTFDLNRYRPLIIKQVEAATGKKAVIGPITLAWKNGLAVRVDKLALADPGDADPDAALDRILVHVELLPLLRKEIRIKGVWIAGPRLVIERSADGTVSVAGIRPPQVDAVPQGGPGDLPESVTPPRGTASGRSVSFFADVVRIENGLVRFVDRSPGSSMDLTVSDLDAEIKEISLTRPVLFAARAAVFGAKQNVAVGGKVVPPAAGKPAVLEDFTLRTDLGSVDPKRLEAALPAVREAGLASVRGILEARVDRLVFDPAQMASAKARVSLKDGELSLSSVPLPLEDVALEASLQNGNADVQNLSARLAGGTLKFQGRIQDLAGRASSEFRASARDLAVGKLARAASARAPRLEGRLALDFEGRAQGLGPSLTQSLMGQGRLALKDGVLVNSNILRTVVDKLSQIPGVGRAAISRIPPQYLQKIDEPNTVLRPFEAPFAVQQGRLFFDRLQIPTDLFVLAGGGSIGFDKSLAMQAAIALEPGLSKALMMAAPPTQYFVNTGTGQIEIQLAIEGAPPNVQVKPNLDAALQRVGQQVVTDLLQKKDAKEIFSGLLSGGQQPAQQAQPQQAGGIPLEPAPGEPQAQPQEEPPSREEQLIGLLAQALKKDE